MNLSKSNNSDHVSWNTPYKRANAICFHVTSGIFITALLTEKEPKFKQRLVSEKPANAFVISRAAVVYRIQTTAMSPSRALMTYTAFPTNKSPAICRWARLT